METPRQIKYLSILIYLQAAIAALIGGVSLISLIIRTMGSTQNNTDLFSGSVGIASRFGLTIMLTILAIGLIIFIGSSLRKLKPWARTVTLVYSLLTLLFGLFSLITGENNISYLILVQMYAVWVLFRPDVKEAFCTGSEAEE